MCACLRVSLSLCGVARVVPLTTHTTSRCSSSDVAESVVDAMATATTVSTTVSIPTSLPTSLPAIIVIRSRSVLNKPMMVHFAFDYRY